MSNIILIEETAEPIIINKGTGAGGANTNFNGKKFEDKTNNQLRLLENGFVKQSFTSKSTNLYDYYLSKTFEDKKVVFVTQNGLNYYMKNKYNICDVYRRPDEAYIIEYNDGRKVIKILEKKAQNGGGSVEDKLLGGPMFKKCYEKMFGSEFEVFYGYCVSEFLKNKLVSTKPKYTHLNELLSENEIEVLYGDDENYFETFDTWLNNS
jgi:hypothetical protein